MMNRSKGSKDNNESMSRRMANEEHFVLSSQLKNDVNAVFIEDNPQKALDKLVNLASNENYQEKLQYVKHLADLLSVIGKEGVTNLKDIIFSIRNDRDEIKRALLSQISPLVKYLQDQGPEGYQEVVNVIVPTISRLIYSANYDIKEEAGQELSKIAGVLTEDDRGRHLLTIVLSMAHDDENEENRMIAVRLMSQMAPVFGKDLCEQFIGFEFLSMGEDPQIRVRKEAVANLVSIAKVVNPQYFRQRLLSFYLKLCKDPNWGVRKSCIDIVYEVSNICKDELGGHRETDLTEIVVNFLKDTNKWVKISAYKNLGPFISTLSGLVVSDRLIEPYLHMADTSVNNLAPDNEIIFACAYNFPAVVLTLGPSRWPVLLKLFQVLVKSSDKVKKPLACSLHEIAKIIGENKAERDLVQVLDKFLKDPNDDIKFGAIQNLALFLQVFPVEKRENMIDIFLDLQKDSKKWRIRELIANQIDNLTTIFPPEITFSIIAPISFKLCNDTVAIVRDEAARKIHAVVKALYDSEPVYRESVIETVKGFSISNKYTNRQAFIAMCEKITKYPEIFKNHFLECLIPLSDDRVANVRIALAKSLVKIFKKNRDICSDPEMIKLVRKLQNDASKDVKSLIKLIPQIEETTEMGLDSGIDELKNRQMDHEIDLNGVQTAKAADKEDQSVIKEDDKSIITNSNNSKDTDENKNSVEESSAQTKIDAMQSESSAKAEDSKEEKKEEEVVAHVDEVLADTNHNADAHIVKEVDAVAVNPVPIEEAQAKVDEANRKLSEEAVLDRSQEKDTKVLDSVEHVISKEGNEAVSNEQEHKEVENSVQNKVDSDSVVQEENKSSEPQDKVEVEPAVQQENEPSEMINGNQSELVDQNKDGTHEDEGEKEKPKVEEVLN